MKKIILCFIVIILASAIKADCQTNNDFRIGMYSFDYKKSYNNPGDSGFFTADLGTYGKGTSQLKVLSEDGFNTVVDYLPSCWALSPVFMRSYIKLVKNNNLQCMLNSAHYYKPVKADYTKLDGEVYGENIFNFNNGDSNYGARPNYDTLIDVVYSDTAFKDVIWGLQMAEEASARHGFAKDDSMRKNDSDTTRILFSEVPIENLSDAINHFRQKLQQNNMNKTNLIIMEAMHNGAINDYMHDREVCPTKEIEKSYFEGDRYSHYQVDEYLRTIEHKPDIFFEGSYFNWVPDWRLWHLAKYDSAGMYDPDNIEIIRKNKDSVIIDTTRYECMSHYLGGQKSIDWAYKYVNNVQKVVNIETRSADSITRLHKEYALNTDTNINNCNYLWFKVYTSIIHNAKGIWFWGINWARDSVELEQYNSIPYSNKYKYNRDNFPRVYRNFVSSLARELRYLVNKNLLSTDSNTYVAYKTDKNDKYGIITPYKAIIPDSANFTEHYVADSDSIINNHYNLRYTIRTNGTEDVMIVTNPLFGAKCQTQLNFKKIAEKDDIIRNSNQCKLLFEKFVPTDTSMINTDYKTIRYYNDIDLRNMTIADHYVQNINFDTAFTLAFGNCDTHILLFDTVAGRLFDERMDTTEAFFNNIGAHSEIRTGAKGNIFYVRNDGRINMIYDGKHTDWLGDSIVTNGKSGFDIDKDNNILYFLSDAGKLRGVHLNNMQPFEVNDNSSLNINTTSRIFYRNGYIYCQRDNGQITKTNVANGVSEVLNKKPMSNKHIGFTINKTATQLYFQGNDKHIYKIALNDNNKIEEIYSQLQIRNKSNLHCNTNLYFIRNDGRLHLLWYNGNEYVSDWISSDVKVMNGTDFVVTDNNVYYIGLDSLIYEVKTNNSQIQLFSPTKLVRANSTSKIYYSGGNIYYAGSGDKAHRLQYRNNNYYKRLDLSIKDSPEDMGEEPNNSSEILYASEDIWIRNQQDGLTNQITENPEYNMGNPVYVYVRVRNSSHISTKGTEKVKLSWAKAGVDLYYPYSWNGSVTYTAPMGGIVGEKIIPSIMEPGEEQILCFEWTIPNPNDYEVDKWHFCLLAEITNSIEDTINGYNIPQ